MCWSQDNEKHLTKTIIPVDALYGGGHYTLKIHRRTCLLAKRIIQVLNSEVSAFQNLTSAPEILIPHATRRAGMDNQTGMCCPQTRDTD